MNKLSANICFTISILMIVFSVVAYLGNAVSNIVTDKEAARIVSLSIKIIIILLSVAAGVGLFTKRNLQEYNGKEEFLFCILVFILSSFLGLYSEDQIIRKSFHLSGFVFIAYKCLEMTAWLSQGIKLVLEKSYITGLIEKCLPILAVCITMLACDILFLCYLSMDYIGP